MCDWDFIESALTTHNHWRQRHGVPNLRHNPDLARLAQGWAVHIANTGKAQSSVNTYRKMPLGENIAIRGSSHGEDLSGREVCDMWYSGIARYDFQTHMGEDTGQFTQLVWRNTEYFGIGKAFSDDGRCVVVANYYPAGNVVGEYGYNVLPTVDGRVILPSDNRVKRLVKTDRVREYHGGLPFMKTIVTETTIKPDGSRSTVTSETLDRI